MASAKAIAKIATMRVPKFISPGWHAVADYATVGAYALAAVLSWRKTKRASVCAMIQGGMVLGASMLTDYPGGAWKVMSFKTHRAMDIAQAASAGVMPMALGFSGKPSGKFFEAQAAGETFFIRATDWDAMNRHRRGRRAA